MAERLVAGPTTFLIFVLMRVLAVRGCPTGWPIPSPSSKTSTGCSPSRSPRAGRLGVRSALSLPLLVDGCVIGALNVYGRRFNSFDEVSVGESFAQPAAVTAALGGSSP